MAVAAFHVDMVAFSGKDGTGGGEKKVSLRFSLSFHLFVPQLWKYTFDILHTLADFIPPQHPVLQLGGIHPRLEAISRKICADVLAHLLLYMAITDKDLIFVFQRTSSFPFFSLLYGNSFSISLHWREKILAYHISTRARGCFGGSITEQFFLRLIVQGDALPCRAEAVL